MILTCGPRKIDDCFLCRAAVFSKSQETLSVIHGWFPFLANAVRARKQAAKQGAILLSITGGAGMEIKMRRPENSLTPIDLLSLGNLAENRYETASDCYALTFKRVPKTFRTKSVLRDVWKM